jgi:hypothetical protein
MYLRNSLSLEQNYCIIESLHPPLRTVYPPFVQGPRGMMRFDSHRLWALPIRSSAIIDADENWTPLVRNTKAFLHLQVERRSEPSERS